MSGKLRHAFDLHQFIYPANLLTNPRLLMLPAALRYMRQPDDRWCAIGVLAAAMLSDALDGPIARRRHEVSPLGKVLDPIADKILIDATAIALSQMRGFPWWATGALLVRDAGILLGAAFVFRRRAEITVAHASGKATTLALTATMLLYIADGPRSGRPALYLSLLPFGYSIAHYLWQFKAYIRE